MGVARAMPEGSPRRRRPAYIGQKRYLVGGSKKQGEGEGGLTDCDV